MGHGHPRQAVLLAYLAGLLDGEGCFRINRCGSKAQMERHNAKSPTYYGSLQCGMVEKAAIELLQQEFGGSVYEERVRNRRSIWRWRLHGRADIIACLEKLMPYLMIKKPQAEVVYRFCQEWKTPFNRKLGIDPDELLRREDAYQAICKLNAVGAAATTERSDTREGEATV